MDIVNFGIIGVGGAWQFHKLFFKNSQNAKVKSVFDINERKARKAARSFNANVYSDLQNFLDSEIDAVLIMVPHYLHEELIIRAAEAGKHILCEKPMATTLEACDNIIKAVKKAGIKFMIAENHRFLPAHEFIANFVNKGLLGDIFLVRAYEGVNELEGLNKRGFWKGDPILAGGGSLMDMGVHKFATLNWILDDRIDSAYSWLFKQCTKLDEKAEDNALVFAKYKKGTIAEIAVSFTVKSEFTNSIEIYGTKGTILENHMWNKPVKIQSFHEELGEKRGVWFEPEIEHGPFPKYYSISAIKEDQHFTECIIENKNPKFTAEQAREAVAAVLLCYLSARRGRITYYEELQEVYKSKGTACILQGLEKFIQKRD